MLAAKTTPSPFPYSLSIILILISTILGGCQSSSGISNIGGTRIDNIPKYGQPNIVRSDQLKKADQDFISEAIDGFGSRKKASEVWWAQGEQLISEGNLDYAMRRYNQAWLLNPNNYQPYWGFARVTLQQRKVDEAIGYLEKAETLINDPYQKVALLSDLGSAYSIKGKESPSYYDKANKKFSESTELDPSYGGSWRRWAFSLFEQSDYSGAWVKVKKAQSLNAKPFPDSFISSLEEKSSNL